MHGILIAFSNVVKPMLENKHMTISSLISFKLLNKLKVNNETSVHIHTLSALEALRAPSSVESRGLIQREPHDS